MAERDRLQDRSGRRIRAPKQSGAVSFILFRVRAKVQLVQFRATITGRRGRAVKRTAPDKTRGIQWRGNGCLGLRMAPYTPRLSPRLAGSFTTPLCGYLHLTYLAASMAATLQSR